MKSLWSNLGTVLCAVELCTKSVILSLSLSLSLSLACYCNFYSVRMASNEDVQGTSNIDIQLTENDIPGASLKEPFESHTVSELRWWLLCHGITVPASWKKPQVILRYISHLSLLLNRYRTNFTNAVTAMVNYCGRTSQTL